ncbi:MAG: CPBP family intramembrane metalloprotease, partial [Oscillospiraceae bacterium]|nr:CPBP family intramembrane metalloprotease [Oscillospiraceae bacterium]
MPDTGRSVMLFEGRKARYKPHIILQILIFMLVMLVSQLAAGMLAGVPIGIALAGGGVETAMSGGMQSYLDYALDLMNNLPEWFSLVSLFLTAATTLLVLVYCRKLESRSYASLGLTRRGFVKNYGIGFLVGAVMISAAAGLSVLLGGTELRGLNGGVSYLFIALYFAGFLVQGMSEEVSFRGYLMVSCANKVRAAAAVGISSVIFAMFHLANSGISPLAFVNLALFGVFAALYVLRTDDLWGACAIHSAWNFFQGNIFGISVSGAGVRSALFGTRAISGRELISGGTFGIEGGLCATAV